MANNMLVREHRAYTEKYLTQFTHDFKISDILGVASIRDDDLGTNSTQVRDNVPAKVAGGTKHSNNQSVKRRSATSTTF